MVRNVGVVMKIRGAEDSESSEEDEFVGGDITEQDES